MTADAGCEIEALLLQLDSEFLASESVRGIFISEYCANPWTNPLAMTKLQRISSCHRMFSCLRYCGTISFGIPNRVNSRAITRRELRQSRVGGHN